MDKITNYRFIFGKPFNCHNLWSLTNKTINKPNKLQEIKEEIESRLLWVINEVKEIEINPSEGEKYYGRTLLKLNHEIKVLESILKLF